jgi:hypothetical protein
MKPTTTDFFPIYDGQDLSAFEILMLHRVESHLGLTEKGTNLEDDMRNRIQAVKPGVLQLLSQVMEAYRDWTEALGQ